MITYKERQAFPHVLVHGAPLLVPTSQRDYAVATPFSELTPFPYFLGTENDHILGVPTSIHVLSSARMEHNVGLLYGLCTTRLPHTSYKCTLRALQFFGA